MIVQNKLTKQTFEFEPKDFISKSSKFIFIKSGHKADLYYISECGTGPRGKDGQKGIICNINEPLLVTTDKLYSRIKDFSENY